LDLISINARAGPEGKMFIACGDFETGHCEPGGAVTSGVPRRLPRQLIKYRLYGPRLDKSFTSVT
jgi:hypothetical protein